MELDKERVVTALAIETDEPTIYRLQGQLLLLMQYLGQESLLTAQKATTVALGRSTTAVNGPM